MRRLIDLDSLLFDMEIAFKGFKVTPEEHSIFRDLLYLIRHAKVIDPVKHGHWIRTEAYPHRVYCSKCYVTFIRNDEFLRLSDIPHNYCANCGALMDEEAQDEVD